MYVALFALAAIGLDRFIAPGIAPGFSLYAGFLGVILLVRQNKHGQAFALAASYGALMDVLSPVVPFGTLLLAHCAAYFAIIAAQRLFSGADMRRTMLAAAVLLFAYAVFISLSERFAMALFGGIPPGTAAGMAQNAALGAAATTGLAVVAAYGARLFAARAGHVFFSTRR